MNKRHASASLTLALVGATLSLGIAALIPPKADAFKGSDSVTGGDLNDRLSGGGSGDKLDGGRGNDTLSGGPGGDKLLGGPGRDILRGGSGSDKLVGGPGRDQEHQ